MTMQSGSIPSQIVRFLTGCPLFKGLGEDELAGLLESASGRIRHFGKGEIIARAGEEVCFQHIVISGSVRGEMVDFSGKVIKIEEIAAPGPLAVAFLFGDQNRYPVNIIAGEETGILSIPGDMLLKMMQANSLILRNFINAVSTRGQFLSGKIRFLSFTTIKGKLAEYFLDLSEKTGKDAFEIPLSQSQLSELFGVARPSIGRALIEMNREGIIRTTGRQVILADRARLSSLLK